MDHLIRERFPRVAQISSDTLAAWLLRPRSSRPLLLDIRAADEFAVSHLQGAKRADLTPADLAAIRATALRSGRPVVVYCSVGYRSSAFASALAADPGVGVTDTLRCYNLEGGIFRWANEARPLYRGSARVQQVHPYDAKWGRLLAPALHPTEPLATKTP
jgi:rhodanese-related sulfurtransferase